MSQSQSPPQKGLPNALISGSRLQPERFVDLCKLVLPTGTLPSNDLDENLWVQLKFMLSSPIIMGETRTLMAGLISS